MAKRRDFMIGFSFSAERAGEFFKLFAPFMEHAENFECTTVEEDVEPVSEPVPDPEAVSLVEASHTVHELVAESWTPRPARNKQHVSRRPGNPTTGDAAKERFRMGDRGAIPNARDIITDKFGEREFMLQEAIEAIVQYNLSPNTAAPTIHSMKTKGQVEHLDTNRYRIKPEYLQSRNNPQPQPAEANGNGVDPHYDFLRGTL